MVVLKRFPHVGLSLYILHVPTAFGGRAGFDLNISHVFPQSVQAAITLLVCGAGERGAKANARF